MTAEEPTVSYTEVYKGYVPDLALPGDLEDRLLGTLDGDDREAADAVRQEINHKITALIQQHGVDIETGVWHGDWSAEGVVRAALDRAARPA